jgi:hypothetical protein
MPPQYEESPTVEETTTQPEVSYVRTLAALFSEEPARLDQVLPVFAGILSVLDSIHREGLRHDLLSPSSIRLSEDGKPEIRTRNTAQSSSDTVAVADPKYALPESFREGTESTPCAVCDSYALGLIFYELFLGRRRFRGQFPGIESNNAVAWLGWHADRSRKPTPLAELLPNFPRSLSKLIEEMTEKDPAKRAAELSRILQTLESANDTTFAPGGAKSAAQGAVISQSAGPKLRFHFAKLLAYFGNLKQRAFASRGGPAPAGARNKPEPTTKLDDVLQQAEERFLEASGIAKRAAECEQNSQTAEAFEQWKLVREIYPDFPNLEANIRRLGQIDSDPGADEPDFRASQRMADSTAAVFEHVFAERHAAAADSWLKSTRAKWMTCLGVAAIVLLTGGFLARRFTEIAGPASHRVPVEFQANAPGAQFTVDGRPTLAVSLNLEPGSHRADADAPGYESQSKTFTVSESGSAPVVVFTLQSLLPSLRVTTPFKGAKCILDGDDPIDLDDGSFTEEHLVSGIHSLRIVTDDKQLFSLNFTTEPQKMPEIAAHSEFENVSALIVSSFKDSAKLYASQDWKVSFGGDSSRPVASDGVNLPPQAKSGAEAVATSADGETRKLDSAATRAPVLNVSLRKLPPRIPVVLSANVTDPAIVVNGHKSDQLMADGRTVLSLYPGTYRIGLTHPDYFDSPIREINLEASNADPDEVQFVLKPMNSGVLLGFGPEANGAEIFVDGTAANTSRAGGQRTLLVQAGHHVINVRKKNFEDLSISRGFSAGELVNLSLAGMKPFAFLSFRLSPGSAVLILEGTRTKQTIRAANGTMLALPAGGYTATASAPDFETVSQTLVLESGKASTLRLILIPIGKTKAEDGSQPGSRLQTRK